MSTNLKRETKSSRTSMFLMPREENRSETNKVFSGEAKVNVKNIDSKISKYMMTNHSLMTETQIRIIKCMTRDVRW